MNNNPNPNHDQNHNQQVRRNPLNDFLNILMSFANGTVSQLESEPDRKEALINYIEGIDAFLREHSSSPEGVQDIIKTVIKPIVKKLSKQSKNILYRNACIFAEPLLLFNDQIDVSKIWRKQNKENREIMWDFIEQLYVIGYIVCYPDKKSKFLQLIKAMKNQSQNGEHTTPANGQDQDEPDTTVGGRPTNGNKGSLEGTSKETQQAVEQINKMFGIQENDVMNDMIGDIAVHMNGMMNNTSDQEKQDMWKSMMKGDMSMFDGMMNGIGEKVEQKIASGEIDRNELEERAKSMTSKFEEIQQQMGGLMGMMGGQGGQGLQQMMSMMGGDNQRMPDLGDLGDLGALQQMMSQMPQPTPKEPEDVRQSSQMMQQMGMSQSKSAPPNNSSNNKKKKKKNKK